MLERRSHTLIATLLFLAAFVSVGIADEYSDKIDAMFGKWDRPDVAGCAVGVIHEGELIYTKGFGSANLDYEIRNTPQTVFEIASFAKTFTSTCIAILMDEGKIGPDTELHKIVPEMHAFDPPIRIRHMLRCETGLWAQFHIMPLAGWDNLPVQGTYYKDDLLTLLTGQRRLPFEPGSDFQYGSSDFFLLGIIVERLSGKTLAEFARERIFEPLGMKRTFYQEDPSRVIKNRAVGHYKEPDKTIRQWRNNSYVAGGGGVNTCIEDLLLWDRNFGDNKLPHGKYVDEMFSKGTVLGNRFTLDADAFLKKASPDHYSDNPPGQYRGLKRLQFTGGFWGSSFGMARFPDEDFTFICLSNTDEISGIGKVSEMADVYLADKLDPKPTKPEKKYVEVAEADLKNKVGTFTSLHGIVWRIEFADGKLWNNNHIRQRYELKPLGNDRFEASAYPTDTFVFKRPSPDEHFELKVEWPGGVIEHTRVEAATPTADELVELAGEYYSDELLTTYRFKVEDESLWLRLNNRRWEQLDPTTTDQFTPHIRTSHDTRIFKFRRDDEGKVRGLTASFWRIRGVDFVKQ